MGKTESKEDLLTLVQANEGIIYKICHTYCTLPDEREDLAQEILYQLFRSYKRYDPAYRFTTWMYRVALNTAISFYRVAQQKRGIIALEGTHAEIADPDPGDGEHGLDVLHRCLAQQKELDKALMLLYLESKSYKEIAEIMGITETNVATKISRIKEKLKHAFHQH